MRDDPFIIRQSKKSQLFFLIASVIIILSFFYSDEKIGNMYDDSPAVTIILAIVLFGLFFLFLHEMIKRNAEITLTKKGIELRFHGFFNWEMIESFKTVYYCSAENDSTELVLQFKEYADIKFGISYLEKDKDEIIELILEYKGTANVSYTGHEVE